MQNILIKLAAISRAIVSWLGRRNHVTEKRAEIGFRVTDGEPTRHRVTLSAMQRTMHIAALGKSGTGKSSLLKLMSQQDIEAGRGFVYFDLHGDATPFLLRSIAARERKLRKHLSEKLVVIAPADTELSVGLNPLEMESPDFVRIMEFSELLKHRWHLGYFGARTEELLRNSLYILAANRLTLLELAPLLTHDPFRAACLKHVDNLDIREYFESRYG